VKYYLESLGCPKNLVDAHGMSRLLKRIGYQAVDDPAQAQVLIVNTCGFVEDAREESLLELRELARGKRDDQVLIAAGCLSQRWGETLVDQVPGVDALLGTRRWSEIGALVQELRQGQDWRRESPLARLGDPLLLAEAGDYRIARQGAAAYLKIADGCSAPCAFCAIPLIKGSAVSRPAELVVEDAVELVHRGVKEIILIAQDTTAYGRDLGRRDTVSDLVQMILDAVPDRPEGDSGPGLHWLRLMYAYPGHISPRLIEVMAGDPRVCHYLDLPLQHAHPDTLRRMRRPANVERTRRLVADLRAAMPDVALRTTFIVGYPHETDDEFQALLDFVSEVRFDRVGVFTFSHEPGTVSESLGDPIATQEKEERRDRLMRLQQKISLEINQAFVGRTLQVLTEGSGDGITLGRSYRDAPEIDGLVIIDGEHPLGEMLSVRIDDAMPYDLAGFVEDSDDRAVSL